MMIYNINNNQICKNHKKQGICFWGYLTSFIQQTSANHNRMSMESSQKFMTVMINVINNNQVLSKIKQVFFFLFFF